MRECFHLWEALLWSFVEPDVLLLVATYCFKDFSVALVQGRKMGKYVGSVWAVASL